MHTNDADSNTHDIDRQTYLSIMCSFMSINKSIYIHAHIAIYISIKVNVIHIFHMNIHQQHHIFRSRFMYMHTFFCSKIMCSCRLATCLYDIRQTSYERRLHNSHVAPSEPIWAEFISALGNIYPQLIRATTPVLSHASQPRLYIGIYYWGKIRLT